jgi:LCP family protein required for cell wall assembly
MDADVTDSAGTPAEPDGPAKDKPPTETPGPGDGTDEAPKDEPARGEAETGEAATGEAAKISAEDTDEVPQDEATGADGTDEAPQDEATTHEAADADDAGPADDTDDEAPERGHHLLRWVALGTSVVVLAAAGAGWWFYRKLDANITTDTTAAAELETYEKERPTPLVADAQNILLLGSDSRSGKGNSKYGRDDSGSRRSDTTILVHIAADRQSATAMSVPRDLMVTIPSCRKPDGTRTRQRFGQFNGAFESGGTACTIRTVERFTRIRIDHHMVVDFSGFKDMVDAVNGVDVCLKEPINDEDAHLKLPAGKQTLHGEEALGFVRVRKSIGNGSDTERMDRQQQFLGALVKKVQSNGVLLNPTRLYPVLDAATKSLTTDPGLDSLKELHDLTRSIRSVPTEKVQFLTVPRQPYAANPNRDELIESEARALFKRLREDTPVEVIPRGSEKSKDAEPEKKTRQPSNGSDEETDPTDQKPDDSRPGSPTPVPTFSGTNAAVGMCE